LKKYRFGNQNNRGAFLYFALIELIDRKANSVDKIPAEVLTNLDEDTKNSLFNILTESYEYDKILTNFTQNKTITLPKKRNSAVCSNYRNIALLSHPFKILLNIVKNRIKKRVDLRIDEDQFGFRSGRGTRKQFYLYK